MGFHVALLSTGGSKLSWGFEMLALRMTLSVPVVFAFFAWEACASL